MQDKQKNEKRENRLLASFKSNPFGTSIFLTGILSLVFLSVTNFYNGDLSLVIYNQFVFLFCGIVLGLIIDWVSFKKRYR